MLWCILFCGWYDRIKMKYWRSFIEIKAAGDWQKRKSIISACARLSLHTLEIWSLTSPPRPQLTTVPTLNHWQLTRFPTLELHWTSEWDQPGPYQMPGLWSRSGIRNQESGWRLRDQWHWCGQDLDCQQCHQPIRKLFSDCVHPFVPLQHIAIALTLTCINMTQPESNALQDFENMSNERSLPGKSCFEVSFNLFCCCSLLCVFNHCYFHRIMDGSIIHTQHRSQDVIAELEVALSRE